MVQPANDNFIRRRDVEQRTGLSCSSIYELMQHPDPELRFPRPVKIGPGRVRWMEDEVQAWKARQKTRRDTAA
ncbi:AlpA family phage regulatory protein [Mesorhizobium sp. USDA-HM6]|nr:AlpA family phage regulatory protein [Mesorhizobium sp. USDA-HM6]